VWKNFAAKKTKLFQLRPLHQTLHAMAAMLERAKSVVGQLGGVRMAENAEDSAIMFGIILFSLHRARR
jgi:hypothetical protein